MSKTKKPIKEALEMKAKNIKKKRYRLRLYVAGLSPKSLRAIDNIKALCRKYLGDNFDLDIIDLYQNPLIAKDGQIIAAPTLVKELPLPLRKFIGDMSDAQKLIVGMDIETKKNK